MEFRTVLITLFILAVTTRPSWARSDLVEVIVPPGTTFWGDWGEWEYCPEGHWVDW